ncbi:7907_t:CDS:2 [Cetraspora pellucida]|uniref:7907_t:CDS:1 n=1 Tax=Cetraspora pellucida TaxID=1433469 RepID=A0A9N9N7H1_9GLOM|nr:7907_t:CDS:2 [Cetraspora pellucida]
MENPLIETFRLGKILQLSVSSDENVQKTFERVLHQWQSCLSTRVVQLILPTECNKVVIGSGISFGNVICNNGLLRQEAILSIRENSFPFDTSEVEAFNKASLKIKLVAMRVAQFMDSNISTANDFFDLYVEELKWCGYSDCIDLYHKQDFFTSLLLGISSLERILGDIIYSIRNGSFIIPSLIRDLLIAPPLVPLLGEDIIFFLRCLIGPPSSMNLRNILWHGFVSPNEFLPIPAKWYSALIIVVTLTICHRVRLRDLIESLKKRNDASFEGFFRLSQPNIIAENITTSDEINKIFDQEYERIMFSQMQEHWLGTVEVGQYFLTLDIILEEKVSWAYYGLEKEIKDEEPRNQIYEEFGGGIMDLMLDLFIYNAGPRLRDRIAHGEANHLVTSTKSDPLYEYYICLLVVLWSRYKSKVLIEQVSPYPLTFERESARLVTITWNCWKIAHIIEQKGRFTLGDWTELMFKEQEDSLFQQNFLKAIAKMESIGDVLYLSCEKLNTIKFRRFRNGKEFHWSRISITKEYLKLINLKRVVVKKAIYGVEKLCDILRTLHSSTSLSSRKRKNTQNLFTLFPLIMQHLYYSLFILDHATEQKFMLGILIFVERWCSFCAEGEWKKINEAFDEFIKLSSGNADETDEASEIGNNSNTGDTSKTVNISKISDTYNTINTNIFNLYSNDLL